MWGSLRDHIGSNLLLGRSVLLPEAFGKEASVPCKDTAEREEANEQEGIFRRVHTMPSIALLG